MSIAGKDIVHVVMAALPVLAIVISLVSLIYSRQSLKIAEAQEKRRRPVLTTGLVESFLTPAAKLGRIYSFHISVRNPSDADNAIASVEFAIRYSAGDASFNVKLPPSAFLMLGEDGRRPLEVPTRLAAHDTVAGWCDFVVGPQLLDKGRIDSYDIIITDTHQAETRLEVSVVRERPHA